MNIIPVEEQTEEPDEAQNKFYYRIIDGVKQHTQVLAYCTLSTIIFLISAVLLCIYRNQVKSFCSCCFKPCKKISTVPAADYRAKDEAIRFVEIGKQTDGSLLMGIESSTLGPSPLQPRPTPIETLTGDRATPQLCGLRPVTETSEIEAKVTVNSTEQSDETRKVMLSEEKMERFLKTLHKRSQE